MEAFINNFTDSSSGFKCKTTAHENDKRKKVQVFWAYCKGRKI